MKLISLNTWGGRAGKDKLLKFFSSHKDVDYFCLQEVWSAPYSHLEGHSAGGLSIDHSNILVYGLQEISKVLNTHTPYFRPHHLDNYGLLLMVKNNLEVISEGDVFVHKDRDFVPVGDVGLHARNVQFVTTKENTHTYTVINFHGLWNGQGKGDSNDRLTQSANIIKFLQTLQTPYLICGDFNLLPNTESIAMLERFGLKNLITEFKIPSTRTSIYTKPEKHADYCLISPQIKVNDFRVLTDEISDHSPLFLDFE